MLINKLKLSRNEIREMRASTILKVVWKTLREYNCQFLNKEIILFFLT